MKIYIFILITCFSGFNLIAQKNKKGNENLSEMEQLKKALTELEYTYEEKKFAQTSYLDVKKVYEGATSNTNISIRFSVVYYDKLAILELKTPVASYWMSVQDDETTMFSTQAPDLLSNAANYKIGALQAEFSHDSAQKIIYYAIKIPFTADKDTLQYLIEIAGRASINFKP